MISFSHITPAHLLKQAQLCRGLIADCICIVGMTRTFHSNHLKGHIALGEIQLNSFEFNPLTQSL